jgi:hypothetical protein
MYSYWLYASKSEFMQEIIALTKSKPSLLALNHDSNARQLPSHPLAVILDFSDEEDSGKRVFDTRPQVQKLRSDGSGKIMEKWSGAFPRVSGTDYGSVVIRELIALLWNVTISG